MKLEFSLQIFWKKKTNRKFHENPSCWSRVVHADWQTDKQRNIRTDRLDETNDRFSEFFERAQKNKKGKGKLIV